MNPSDDELDPWSEAAPERSEGRGDAFEEWPKEEPVAAGVIPGVGRLASAARRPGSVWGTRNGARWFVILILLLVVVPIIVAFAGLV